MPLSKFAVASIALPIVLAVSTAFAQPLLRAAPPAQNRSTLAEKSTPPSLLLDSGVQAHRIALTPPSGAELERLKARNAQPLSPKVQRVKSRALAIAFGRAVPASAASIALRALPWQTLQDGSRAARIEIASPGAAALRVALRMPVSDPDLEVRFGGTVAGAPTFGPVPANRIAGDSIDYGMYWSPVIAGEVAVLELHAGTSTVIDGEQLQVAMVSHQVVGPADLKSAAAKLVEDIGTAGSCNVDIKCRPQTPGLVNQSKAVAEIEITQDDGETVLCTGQLLNDTGQTLTPWFFTANH
ncbi:MAG TPA: hypothetical protein VMV45_00240, partial [Casimicrobiaceae bacterium]|nr:hypothetical protein [Casimicrobiaceae bacterium]